MPILTDILDEPFVQWLQSTLTLTLGKMSVVFEHISGEPVGAVRMFAVRVDEKKGKNLCECMIDCDLNPSARKACKDSDADASRQASSKLKTCLYRCHRGKGFVNLAIPIKIWENIVVGNLYAGQFLLKIPKDQQEKFIEDLKQYDFYIPEGQTIEKIVRDLSEGEIYDFYKEIIPLDLQSKFKYDDFLEQFRRQQENGMTSIDFINAVDLLEKLANYLSELGNRLYTLKAFVDLKRRLPASLLAHYKADLDSLEESIEKLILSKKEGLTIDERASEVENVHSLSLKTLLLLKAHETDYTSNLFKPYLEHMLPVSEDVQQLALQFCFLRVYYEMERYPKIREIAERCYLAENKEEGDNLWEQFFEISKNIGEYQGSARTTVTEDLVKLHKNAPFLFRVPQLVSDLMHIYRNDKDIVERVLREQGIYRVAAQDLHDCKGNKVSSYKVPFHIILRRAEKIADEMKKVNDKILEKTDERAEPDIEEVLKYIEQVMRIRNGVISFVAFSPEFPWVLNNRKKIALRFDRTFLNSGGLGITHDAVLEAERWWIAERNERGPVGLSLEKKLNSKIEDVRKSLARLVGSKLSDNIVFTNSTTGSIKFVLDSILFQRDDEIVITDLEHDVVEYLTSYLQRKYSIIPEIAKISDSIENEGKLTQKITDKINSKTKLVILSHITFSTGSILPIKKLIKKTKEKHQKVTKGSAELLVLVDGAQAVGNLPVNVNDINCDFYAFDGHKWLLGPEGTGGLYVKEFLKKVQKGAFYFPITSAFMVSEEIASALKLVNNNGWELGTTDAAKIIGLGSAINVLNTIKLENVIDRKKVLTSRFISAINDSSYLSIINPDDALKTGIVCLKVNDFADYGQYRNLVAKLQDLNVFARYIKNPACLRLCFHYYNSETDVDIAISSLKSFMEGYDIHRANQLLVKEHIRDIIIESMGKGLTSGLLIYGPPGTGKSTVVEEVFDELRQRKEICNSVKIEPKEIFSSKISPEQQLAEKLANAREKTPSCVFFEEADSILTKDSGHLKGKARASSSHLNALVGTFITTHDEIVKKKEKVFFIGAVNEIENIAMAVRDRRLTTAYFPLPAFETRLKFLTDKAQETKEIEDIAYERIAEATDGFSMADMEKLWGAAARLSKRSKIEQWHFDKALRSVRPSCDEVMIKKFDILIKKLGSIILSSPR
jgi:L-cysteine/cystine lyase